MWAETCYLVAPWMSSSEGQLVVSCRAGQPVELSMADCGVPAAEWVGMGWRLTLRTVSHIVGPNKCWLMCKQGGSHLLLAWKSTGRV